MPKSKTITDQTPAPREYSFAEHEAAKIAYLQLGRERSLEKIAQYAGIKLGTLKGWSSKEGWDAWVKAQEEIAATLALRGLYDPSVLYLNNQAKTILGQIIKRGSELLEDHKVLLKGNDITMAAKLALDLTKDLSVDEKVSGPDWPVTESASEQAE